MCVSLIFWWGLGHKLLVDMAILMYLLGDGDGFENVVVLSFGF
jgi:hypothetical protein